MSTAWAHAADVGYTMVSTVMVPNHTMVTGRVILRLATTRMGWANFTELKVRPAQVNAAVE